MRVALAGETCDYIGQPERKRLLNMIRIRTTAQRNQEIDIARGICILLVVYGHMARGLVDLDISESPDVLKKLDFILYTTHMPVFFLISGYNLIGSSARSLYLFSISRFWAFIYPYFVWSCALYVAKYVLSMATNINHPISFTDLIAITTTPIGSFWFLYAITLIQFVTFFAQNFIRAFLVFSFVCNLFATMFGPILPSIIVATMLHIPFFAVGLLLRQRGVMLSGKPFGLTATLGLITVFCLGCGASIVSGHGAPVSAETLPISACGIALIFKLAQAVGRMERGLLSYLGRHTLPIYLLHIFFLPLVPRLLWWTHIKSDAAVLIFATTFSTMISLFAYSLLCRAGIDGVLGLSGRVPLPLARRSKPQV